mgnify:CR=1 FL=1|tara:strand:- start:55 stop:723 length:669 start_codon:yes stop_codon:yes gene_type:complete
MTETVWIFGDSFSHRQPSLGARKTWPRMLEKHYNVVNYSLDGTGPDWSLEKLVDSSNDTDTSDISLIFFVSNMHRQNWNFWKSSSHQFLSVELVLNIWFQEVKEVNSLKREYNKYKDFAKQTLKFRKESWSKIEHQKILGMLNLVAPKFKKVLIVYCFDDFIWDKERFILGPNVHIFSKVMETLHTNSSEQQFDGLYNHLPIERHKEIFKTFKNWINNNVQI